MTNPQPSAAGRPPGRPPTLEALLAEREEGAHLLLEQVLAAVTAASTRQILQADAQINALGHLLTGMYTSAEDRRLRGHDEPDHLADLWSLVLYLNDLGRRRPRLRVVVTGDRAVLVNRDHVVTHPEEPR